MGKVKNIVGLKELRENTEKYIRAVKGGKSFTVVRRAEAVFRLTSPDDEDAWETVADFREIDPRGVPIDSVLRALKKING